MIKGTKVGLRAVEEGDLVLLKDWRNLEHFRKNFREVRELSLHHQHSWLQKVNASANDFMFSIVRLSDGKLVGAAGLLYINWILRSADFSIYIGEDEEYLSADGLGGEASDLLIRYGFETLNLNKIWMELYEFDTKKLDYFLKVQKFHTDGILRQNAFYNGSYYDSHIISILAEEYQKRIK